MKLTLKINYFTIKVRRGRRRLHQLLGCSRWECLNKWRPFPLRSSSFCL